MFHYQDCVVHVTASDSGERGLNGPNVNLEDALVSVTERSPHIVLVSWMVRVFISPSVHFFHMSISLPVYFTIHNEHIPPYILVYINIL